MVRGNARVGGGDRYIYLLVRRSSSLPREYVSARVCVARRCVRLTWTCQSGGLVLLHVNIDHERSDGWLSACGMRIVVV
jgi:hypothetical protein